MNQPKCCFECPSMGTDASGQVAICMKSNPGYIDKRRIHNEDTKPEWCPDARCVPVKEK